MTSHTVHYYLSFAALLGAAAGLTVGPVSLVNRSYITYALNNTANNSVIKCAYSLGEGEQVSRVLWKFFEDNKNEGGYIWTPKAGGQASGRLEGVVNLTRGDGMLELTQLRYNLTGEYSCAVELDSGEVQEAAPWEVLIVDIIGAHHLSHYSPGCVFVANFQSATVFPEPTMRAGMYSKSHGGYIEEVSSMEWLKVLYSNGSMVYSYKNFTYQVDSDTPDDVFFEVNIGITKANGDYISLGSIISNSSSWSEHGCPEVKEGKNKEVYYFPGGSSTCRGGRKPTTRATITCKSGYKPQGDVRTVVLRCNAASLQWQPEDGYVALDQDLVCVEDTDTSGSAGDGGPRTALLSNSLSFVSFILVLVLGGRTL